MVAPILYRGRISGTITAIKREEEPDFDGRDVELLLAMANQVAVAIENTRLYEQQRQQVAELEESNEALQAFSQMVAHDLKGPVTVMLGYAELILTSRELYSVSEQELQNYAQLIYKTNRKMGRIINDLLLLAQIRRQGEVPMMAVNMGEVVAEVLLRLRWDIDRAGAKVRCADGWPVVEGYEAWAEEIWVNYLTNALKYGGNTPEILLGFDVIEEAESRVRFWVQDWGPGISAEAQKKLFVEFSRVGTQRVEGHGLGLSIVRRIAERMGGTVGVESEVGMGSRFWFTLTGVKVE
jgi:signal transduction histidine kinase